MPAALGRLGWLAPAGRAREAAGQHRLGAGTACRWGRAACANGRPRCWQAPAPAAKVAAGVVALGVLAGGAVATHVLEQTPRSPHRHVAHSAAVAPTSAATRPLSSSPFVSTQCASAHRGVKTSKRSNRRRGSARRSSGAARASAAGQREPGGFAYLGVPTTPSTSAVPARAASSSEDQHGGGQISP